MEVLFETTKWALSFVDIFLISLFFGVVLSVAVFLLQSEDPKWGGITLAVTFIVGMIVLSYIIITYPNTEYTVKITEDSGYKTILEDYEIVEQKSDTVFVVKEK